MPQYQTPCPSPVTAFVKHCEGCCTLACLLLQWPWLLLMMTMMMMVMMMILLMLLTGMWWMAGCCTTLKWSSGTQRAGSIQATVEKVSNENHQLSECGHGRTPWYVRGRLNRSIARARSAFIWASGRTRNPYFVVLRASLLFDNSYFGTSFASDMGFLGLVLGFWVFTHSPHFHLFSVAACSTF